MTNSNNKEEVKAETFLWRIAAEPAKCPCCDGWGKRKVYDGFGGGTAPSLYNCHACEGTGIIIPVSSTAEASEHQLDKDRADQLESLYIASEAKVKELEAVIEKADVMHSFLEKDYILPQKLAYAMCQYGLAISSLRKETAKEEGSK